MHHLELGQLAELLGRVEDHLSALFGKDTLVTMLLAWCDRKRNMQDEGCNQVLTEDRPHQMRTVCLKRMKVMIALAIICCPCYNWSFKTNSFDLKKIEG